MEHWRIRTWFLICYFYASCLMHPIHTTNKSKKKKLARSADDIWDYACKLPAYVTGIPPTLLEESSKDMHAPDSTTLCLCHPFFILLRLEESATWQKAQGSRTHMALASSHLLHCTQARPKVEGSSKPAWRSPPHGGYHSASIFFYLSVGDGVHVCKVDEWKNYIYPGPVLGVGRVCHRPRPQI